MKVEVLWVPLEYGFANLVCKRQHDLELNTDLSLTSTENVHSLCKFSDYLGTLSVKCRGEEPPPLFVGRIECV